MCVVRELVAGGAIECSNIQSDIYLNFIAGKQYNDLEKTATPLHQYKLSIYLISDFFRFFDFLFIRIEVPRLREYIRCIIVRNFSTFLLIVVVSLPSTKVF